MSIANFLNVGHKVCFSPPSMGNDPIMRRRVGVVKSVRRIGSGFADEVTVKFRGEPGTVVHLSVSLKRV